MLVRIRTRLRRPKREAFFTPPLNHIVVEPLLAALCDPFIAARVVTVEMCVSGGTCNRWSHHVDPFASHRYASHYSQSSLLLMHVVSISSRCLHTSSPLSLSQSPSRAHSLTQLSETANSLPGLCIFLTLFAHILNVVCTQTSSPLSAHQSPSTLPLAASRSQHVPLSLFPYRFLPAS